MKKTYITPEALAMRLMPTAILAMSGNDQPGDGNQLVKEQADGLGSSEKDLWDEAW